MMHTKEYCYSPLDGILVHRRVTSQQYVSGTHLYTWVKRDKVPCLRKQRDGRGLNPRPPDPEFEVLTAWSHTCPWNPSVNNQYESQLWYVWEWFFSLAKPQSNPFLVPYTTSFNKKNHKPVELYKSIVVTYSNDYFILLFCFLIHFFRLKGSRNVAISSRLNISKRFAPSFFVCKFAPFM